MEGGDGDDVGGLRRVRRGRLGGEEVGVGDSLPAAARPCVGRAVGPAHRPGGVAPVEVGEAGAVGEAVGDVGGEAGGGGEEGREAGVVGPRGDGGVEGGGGDGEGVALVWSEPGGDVVGLEDGAEGVLGGGVVGVVVVAGAEAGIGGGGKDLAVLGA